MGCKYMASVVVLQIAGWLMLYTRLASPVAVCIAIRGRYTWLAWLANPNPNPTNPNPKPTNPSRVYTASRVYRRFLAG